MSVQEGKREKGKFKVVVCARELAKYTLDITKNGNIFLPEYQTALTNDIIRTSKNIFMKCWTANKIRANTIELYKERSGLQSHAIIDCNDMLALIDLAQSVYHLKSRRIEYWGEKVIITRTLIQEWQTSEKKRCKFK